MKRPPIIVVLLILHALLLVTYLIGAVTVWNIAHSPDTLAARDAANEVRSLMIGFWAIVGIMAMTWTIAWALWKMKHWVRWLGLIFYGVSALVVTSGIITDSNKEPDDAIAPVTLITLTVLFALPAMKTAWKSIPEVQTSSI